MCAAIGLLYADMPRLYLQEAVFEDPKHFQLTASDIPELWESLRMEDAFLILAWTAEFSVKISLLLFFRRLVDRLPRMTLYVRFVLGFTIIVWIIIVCEPFMICRYFDATMIGETYIPLPVKRCLFSQSCQSTM